MASIVYSIAKEMSIRFHIYTSMTGNKDIYRYPVKIIEVWVWSSEYPDQRCLLKARGRKPIICYVI